MRVIGRVLLGTLAIVFAMVFIARLVHRRRHHARRPLHPALPRALPAAPAAPAHHPARPGSFLAAQPGGLGWGRLVVPPSSPSRALRRSGKRAPWRRGRGLQRAAQRRLSRRAALRMQKTVGAMTFAMPESAPGKQHAAHDGARRHSALPRRLRSGTGGGPRRARAVGWLAVAGAGITSSGAPASASPAASAGFAEPAGAAA